MAAKFETMFQNLYDNPDDPGCILYRTRQLKELKPAVLKPFMTAQPIGVSAAYSKIGYLSALALVTKILEGSHEAKGKWGCLIVEFPAAGGRKGDRPVTPNDQDDSLLQKVFQHQISNIYAFDIAPLAMSLFGDHNLRISNGIDIQSAFPNIVDRNPLKIVHDIVDSRFRVFDENIKSVFRNSDVSDDSENMHNDLILRAWISRTIVDIESASSTFDRVPKVDLAKFPDATLHFLVKREKDALRLEQQKPSQTNHRFQNSRDSQGNYAARALTYKGKFRGDQDIEVTITTGSGTNYVLTGSTASRVDGQSARMVTDESLNSRNVTTIVSVGRDGPTSAQRQRANTLLRILQGEVALIDDNPWIQNIFFYNGSSLVWPLDWHPPSTTQAQFHRNLDHLHMNTSQNTAIQAMLSASSKDHIVVIQGPPGTGKTSVIANYVKTAITSGYRGLWLVAQSNVAVKNIAEKLISYEFTDFRLLVSRDFRYEWHEHLYQKIQTHVIQSDEFSEYLGVRLKGVQVILCTLSMLSNKHIRRFTSFVPLQTLVVDEASQIEVGDYIATFTKFSELRKVCFIGDDKQLPPFGQEEIDSLQSIFEVSHLREKTYLLDTQYRMPPQAGEFISSAVYDNLLKSNPLHPISGDTPSCAFIHADGRESFFNKSFQNDAEMKLVLKLASQLQEKDLSYRIVTPYESQRNLIETSMQESEMQWEDKCFNVDSFQGNEDDYIIISLVRTSELGFLKSLRRTNVMLTRFRRKMYIVTLKEFIQKAGASCLVGRLAEHMGEEAWLTEKDVELGNI
ncbi:DNA2/NAM7 helicase-like C-terminal domain-containing protein [Pleurotus pulmonarius]